MKNSVLVIGYGNPGRRDDGLGPAFADALEKENLPMTTVEANYHLTVEDAALLASHDTVIFADASVSGNEPFFFLRLAPGNNQPSFTTHHIEPSEVLAIARDVFKTTPAAYVLGIRGYEFNEFNEHLSSQARQNLAKATSFVAGIIRENLFDEAASAMSESANFAPANRPAKSLHTEIQETETP